MKSLAPLALLAPLLSGCVFSPAGGLGGALLLPAMGSETAPPDSTYFYIDLDVDAYARQGIEAPLYEISTTEEYGDAVTRDSVSNCEIEYIELGDSSEHSDGKICILDIMEQELFLSPLSLKYNVPAGMCTNVYFSVPWHYNYQVGQGPSEVTECKETTGTDDDQEEETFYCANATNGNPSGRSKTRGDSFTCLASATEIRPPLVCATEEEILCAYNQVGPDGERISCCFGDYDLDGDPKEWGDSLTECIGGPGRTSWDHYGPDGLPIGQSHYVLEDGERRTIVLQDLISAHGRHGYASIPIANYLEALDKPLEDVRKIERFSIPPLDRESHLPKFLQVPATAPASGAYNPGLFFTVECLDQAGEILHQLSLMIREWNTYQEFAEFYESAGADESADPNAPKGLGRAAAKRGQEGEDCEYENRKIINETAATQFCNDFFDFDDYAVDDMTAFPRVDYL